MSIAVRCAAYPHPAPSFPHFIPSFLPISSLPKMQHCPVELSFPLSSSDNLPPTSSSNCQKREKGKKKRGGEGLLSKKGARGVGLKFGGKKPHQVARRNARERSRVQKVNDGYELLANKLCKWEPVCCEKDKKLTKADTLKLAIHYIRHLERILHSPAGQGPKAESTAMQMKWPHQEPARSSVCQSPSSSSSSQPPWASPQIGLALMPGQSSGTAQQPSNAYFQQQFQPPHPLQLQTNAKFEFI